jgi:tripeptidyl-peptidase-1
MYTMIRVLLIFTFTLAVQAVLAGSIKSRKGYAVKERHFVPVGWKRMKRAPQSFTIELNIGLKQCNFAGLERHLYEGMLERSTEFSNLSIRE